MIMNDIARAYGNYIREKRIGKDMTQTDVAKAIGISQQAYGRYELGMREPNFELIIKISEVLGFPPSEFFDRYTRTRLLFYADRLENPDDRDNR